MTYLNLFFESCEVRSLGWDLLLLIRLGCFLGSGGRLNLDSTGCIVLLRIHISSFILDYIQKRISYELYAKHLHKLTNFAYPSYLNNFVAIRIQIQPMKS